MLEITMPTSFEPALLDGLQDLNARYADRGIRVSELYGSLPRSVVGVGRPARSLANVDRAAFEEHARDLRRRGFRLSYLFNGSCSANREFDATERARLLEEMRWVDSLGTRSVVVASPYLIALFRRHFPHIRVHVSSVSFAKSAREVRHYARLGVKRLILDPDTVRDFRFIRAVRAVHPDLEIEALANHPCLLDCPYETYCYNSVAHGSAEDGGAYECFSLLSCNHDKLGDPVEFVRGSWFRPQDAHHFEAAGVNVLKLAGRGRPTEWLLATAEAYLSRDYQGDMMRLIWDAQWAAVRRSLEDDGLPDLGLRVPADRFDGFIDAFASGKLRCREGCADCGHCPGYARRGVMLDEAARETCARRVATSRDRLLDEPRCGSNGSAASGRITALRRRIDAIDDHLVELVARRADHAREIAAAKREAGIPQRDPSREDGIVERLLERAAPGGLDPEGVEGVARSVVAACRTAAGG